MSTCSHKLGVSAALPVHPIMGYMRSEQDKKAG